MLCSILYYAAPKSSHKIDNYNKHSFYDVLLCFTTQTLNSFISHLEVKSGLYRKFMSALIFLHKTYCMYRFIILLKKFIYLF